MILYVVFAQYRESYPDEHAPKAVAVISEFAHEQNPDWIEEELKKARGNTDVVAAEIVEVDLGARAVERIRKKLVGHLSLTGEMRLKEGN